MKSSSGAVVSYQLSGDSDSWVVLSLVVEWAFDPTPLRCGGASSDEGRWSYFVFSLLFSYFVEGRFDGQPAAL